MAKDRYGTDLEQCRVVIFETTVGVPSKKTGELEQTRLWHWQRVNQHGVNIDGSGPSRNGSPDLAAVKRLVRKRFPDDEVEGLGG